MKKRQVTILHSMTEEPEENLEKEVEKENLSITKRLSN